MKLSNFDVLREMSERNLNIKLAPISNIARVTKTKEGCDIVISTNLPLEEVARRISQNEYCGGLILADYTEFKQLKTELEERNGL